MEDQDDEVRAFADIFYAAKVIPCCWPRYAKVAIPYGVCGILSPRQTVVLCACLHFTRQDLHALARTVGDHVLVIYPFPWPDRAHACPLSHAQLEEMGWWRSWPDRHPLTVPWHPNIGNVVGLVAWRGFRAFEQEIEASLVGRRLDGLPPGSPGLFPF